MWLGEAGPKDFYSTKMLSRKELGRAKQPSVPIRAASCRAAEASVQTLRTPNSPSASRAGFPCWSAVEDR